VRFPWSSAVYKLALKLLSLRIEMEFNFQFKFQVVSYVFCKSKYYVFMYVCVIRKHQKVVPCSNFRPCENRRILIVAISVHTVTNTYGSHSCESDVPVLRYSYCMRFVSIFVNSFLQFQYQSSFTGQPLHAVTLTLTLTAQHLYSSLHSSVCMWTSLTKHSRSV
jgi:hypothetical protein